MHTSTWFLTTSAKTARQPGALWSFISERLTWSLSWFETGVMHSKMRSFTWVRRVRHRFRAVQDLESWGRNSNSYDCHEVFIYRGIQLLPLLLTLLAPSDRGPAVFNTSKRSSSKHNFSVFNVRLGELSHLDHFKRSRSICWHYIRSREFFLRRL